MSYHCLTSRKTCWQETERWRNEGVPKGWGVERAPTKCSCIVLAQRELQLRCLINLDYCINASRHPTQVDEGAHSVAQVFLTMIIYLNVGIINTIYSWFSLVAVIRWCCCSWVLFWQTGFSFNTKVFAETGAKGYQITGFYGNVLRWKL